MLKISWNFICLSGAMDSASDFGSGGWGFESPLGLFFFFFRTRKVWSARKIFSFTERSHQTQALIHWAIRAVRKRLKNACQQ